MKLDVESLQQQIPYYLTAQDRQTLVRELSSISRGGTANYFLERSRDDFADVSLQGDGWRGFQLYLFETGERRSVQGIVLSNSCDIDPDNPRDMPSRIIFAPLAKLSTYENILRRSGISDVAINEKIAAIRLQKTTNMFFLPAGGSITEDYVVRLDDAHSMPAAAHFSDGNREKLFTLSNTGFYMFVLKLSVHFCRFQEKVNRKAGVAVSQ